jgi:hypothetical protein
MQSAEQKADFPFVLGRRPHSKKLDYIALWFIKGADYIRGSQAQLAFVTTNSVSQGEHVGLMFPMILAMGLEIGFAYTSFKWENNAKRNAGVTVAVIGLRNVSAAQKYLYIDGLQVAARNINGYLSDGDNVFIDTRRSPLCALPSMAYGSKATDGGNLMLESDERDRLLDVAPEALEFVKRIFGSAEFINGRERYCIWVSKEDRLRAEVVPELKNRFDRTAAMRLASPKIPTQKLAETPYRFGEVRFKPTESIIVPSVSSERRAYVPIGYLDKDTVVSNLAFAVYDAEPWLFSLLTSAMHMSWTRAVGGRMKTDYRYSNTIVYNNFPVPPLSDGVKEKLTVAALRVLDVREYHCEKTLAELYDPFLMPADLRQAHAEVDALVDSIYSKRGYETDEQRLSDLFAKYEEMTAAESARGNKKK